tara:strand:+ start:1190 stop:3733 length:2544 start_codon:yes stop_codon:yes gene_type:complete
MRTNTTQIRDPRIAANVAGKQVQAEDSQQGFSQQDTLNDTLALSTSELEKDVTVLKSSVRTCLRALEVIITNLYGASVSGGSAVTSVNFGSLETDANTIASKLVTVTDQGNTEANDLTQHGGSINSLRQDMADVGTVLNYLFGDVTNINNQVAKITSSSGSTSDDVSDTKDSLNDDKLTIGNLVKDGAKLRQGAETMVSDITNMKTSVQQLVTDVANNTSAVNTLKTETSKAIDDIVELQRSVNASRYDALVKIGSALFHSPGFTFDFSNNSEHFNASTMVPSSVSLPYTMYKGIIYYDTEQDYNSNRILYEAPYANFDSNGTFRVMLKKWHSTHDDPDGKPVANNSHVYFYGSTNGGSTNFGYIGTSQIQMLKMYAISEVDNYNYSGTDYWRIRLKDSYGFGDNYINISGYTNLSALDLGNHVRAAVFNYHGSEFFPYHPPTTSSSSHKDSALYTMYHGFRGETRDNATRTSAEYRRAVINSTGLPSGSRIASEMDYALRINGIIRDLHDPNRAWPGRTALSSGASFMSDYDPEPTASDPTSATSALPGAVSQTSSTPTTSATTPNASSFYSAEFSRGTVTVNSSNNEITFSGQEGYISVGDMVLFSSTNTLPTGIKYGNPYYVSVITNTTGPAILCTVTEPGASVPIVLNFTDNGSGTHSAFEITLPEVATANPVGAVFRGNVTSISSNFVQIATVDGGQSAIENGDRVFFKTANTSHATPSGITKNTVLYVRDKANWNSGVQFKLAISATSSAISLGTTITGTLQCYEGAPNQNSASLGSGVTDNSIRGNDAVTNATTESSFTAPTQTSPATTASPVTTSLPSTNKTEINKDVKSIIKGIDLNL